MFTQFCGHYLIKKQLITEAQFAEILKAQRETRVKLGLIAVSEKLLTEAQASEINHLQSVMDRRFGDIAIEKGYLTAADVSHLLDLQGSPYLSFVQTIVDLGYLTLEQLEAALSDCQKELQLSDADMEAVKSGDVDATASAFIKIDQPFYTDLFGLTLRNIVRFVNPKIYMDKVYSTKQYHFDHLASQGIIGDHTMFLGIAGERNSLLSIASPFGKEDFETVDADALDAICEFINIVNGLFASALSNDGIEIDMTPPLFYDDQEITSEQPFYVLPLYIMGTKVDIIISVDHTVKITA